MLIRWVGESLQSLDVDMRGWKASARVWMPFCKFGGSDVDMRG